jgi:glutamine cyclotransferase
MLFAGQLARPTRRARPTATVVVLTCALTLGCREAALSRSADSTAVRPAADVRAPASYRATVVRSYPHDTAAFTEGLFMLDGRLYESTGLHGKSELREVDLATGAVRRRVPLDSAYFGEGIAALGGRVYQLTYRSGTALTYDLTTLRRRATTFSYPGQGWGMTTDGESLIMSDSTARLRFLDPATFAVRRTLDVHDGGSPVSLLNELEWVDGAILANVWQSDQIVRVDPATGAVTAWIDASGIPAAADRTGREDVLNGIAYDAAAGKLYLTGKHFARLYEVRLDRR